MQLALANTSLCEKEASCGNNYYSIRRDAKTGFLSVVNCCITAIPSSRKNVKILPTEKSWHRNTDFYRQFSYESRARVSVAPPYYL